MRFIFDQHPLSDTQLQHTVPSVFAEHPYQGMSPRYGFISTSNVLDAMRNDGWQPVQARQTSPKGPTLEHARHMLRFRRETPKVDVGDSVAEIVLVNSHDGSSAYQMHAGFFRLVCSNGLVVDDGTFARISIRHSGDVVGRVKQAADEFLREVPRLTASVERMRAVTLSDVKRNAFAESAIHLRFGETAPVAPWQVLTPKRHEEHPLTLWTTFNTIQENLIRGGLGGFNASGRSYRTRPLRAIGPDVRVNKALWQLATRVLEAAA